MRAGVILLSCLALGTNASAQLEVFNAPVGPATLAPDALVVSGDPSSCLVPSTLTLSGISPNGRSTTGIRSIQTFACRWVVQGLAAGSYEIGLTHARGSGGRIRFEYVPGQLTELKIPRPVTTVTGVIRVNGEPVRGGQVMFMLRPMQSGMPKVVTNQDGVFEATLPEAGEVSLRLSGRDIYGQGARATFGEGANQYDWDITGGTLVIRDEHTPRAMSFTINVWYEAGVQAWSAPNFGPLREMRGAPFGAHRITVRRGTGQEETITTVTVSPEAPRAEAVIDVP